jgi:7,8-dihydroneopterin aldolase/epimerase/oxygenase
MKHGDRKRDEILLSGVQVTAWIGVSEQERELPQTVELDAVLVPEGGCEAKSDELAGTIDYEAVWRRLREVAAERPRKLIETLANEMAGDLLRQFPLCEVGIEIRKSILPGTQSAGVKIWRTRAMLVRDEDQPRMDANGHD